MPELKATEKNKMVETAFKQIDVAQRFKQPRIVTIQKSEALYANEVGPALEGSFNYPVPIMPGYVDSLFSKIDNQPALKFEATEEADKIDEKKVQAAWEMESSAVRGNWPRHDRNGKKQAIFTGRAIYEQFAESDPEYRSVMEMIDFYDFDSEPQGGSDIQKHLFCGIENVFRTHDELKFGVEQGWYDKSQLALLQNRVNNDTYKRTEDLFNNKQKRYNLLGLDVQSNNYTGQTLYNMVKWYMQWRGQRYFIFMEYNTRTWLRVVPIKEAFGFEEYPIESWATHEDAYNFLSKATVEDVYPSAEAIREIFNQTLENVQKRGWGQRAYDPEIFPFPEDFEYRKDGLVQAKIPANKSIKDGIYEFQTPDNTGVSVDLMSWLKQFYGTETGVNENTQGVSEENKRVRVQFSDLKQAAERFGTYNKYYSEMWARMGHKYFVGLKDNAPEDFMVKMIGEPGVGWKKLGILNPMREFNISVSSSDAETKADIARQESKITSIAEIRGDPELARTLNPNWVTEELLRSGGYKDEEIRIAMDVENYGNEEILAEAAQEDQKMYKGEEAKPNVKANSAHLQKHLDFFDDLDNEITEDEGNKKLEIAIELLEKHFMAEVPIAAENEGRRAAKILIERATGIAPTGAGVAPTAPATPSPTPSPNITPNPAPSV